MKNKFLLCIIMLIALLFTSHYPKRVYNKPIEKRPIEKKQITFLTKKNKLKINQNQKFLNKLAYFESRGDFKISRGNYIGAYQMHILTLKQFGYIINPDSFRLNPETFNKERQDTVVKELLKYHRRLLWKEIKQYDGKILQVRIDSINTKEIIVTKSGILAAAHLGGAGSISKLLLTEGEYNFRDGNGVPISFYLEKFSEFRVDF